MDRHCVNSKAADQYARQSSQQDDIDLATERLEIEWYDELEHCIHQSGHPHLVAWLDHFSDQIGELIRLMARDAIKNRLGL